MLSRREFLVVEVLAVEVLAVTCGLSAIERAAAADAPGTVMALTGKAVARNGTAERPLMRGDAVEIGDLLQTGSDGRLTVRLGQRTTINLGPSTKLRIEQHLADAGGEFELVEGRMFFDRASKPGAAPAKTEVRSPYGLLAVRGTRFFAGPSAGVFGVFVAEGRVDVSAAGKTVPVNPGFGSSVAKPGVAPTPATRWGVARVRQALLDSTGKGTL